MLPSSPGSYVLVLELRQPEQLTVGRLGSFLFRAGWYLYAGSALGPGGLAARLHRHLKSSKTLHWHIDSLREKARLAEIWYSVDSQRRECDWAQALARLPGAETPVPGFGSTDCVCRYHLILLNHRPDLLTCPLNSSVPMSSWTLG
ncbi:MAG: GIY-YIG nuclease family protein [Chloroflexi bacterium]|nr:GIY-YIG nuclease family protein [Chloroflexota bacterium]